MERNITKMKTNKIRIFVRKTDIERGIPFRSGLCPVALAMNRKTKKRWLVGDCVCGVVGSNNNCTKWIDLPSHVTDWISDFDADKPVIPFSFTLDLGNARKY